MERFPVDGYVLTGRATHPELGDVPIDTHMHTTSRISFATMQVAITAFRTAFTASKKLTHNLFKINFDTPEVLGEPPADWREPLAMYSYESGLNVPLENFKDVLRVVREANQNVGAGDFEGILFDPEPSNKLTQQAVFKLTVRPNYISGQSTQAEYEAAVEQYGFWMGRAFCEILPGKAFVTTLGWEQMLKVTNPPLISDTYYLLSFLYAGLFRAFQDPKINKGLLTGTPNTFTDMTEDVYNRYTAFRFKEMRAIIESGPRILAGPPYSAFPSEWVFDAAVALAPDYPAGQAIDTSNNYENANNDMRPSRFQDAIYYSAIYQAKKYVFVYSEEFNPTAASPTLPAPYTHSIYVGRDRANYAQAPRTLDIENVIWDRDPSYVNLPNDTVMESYTDRCGNVYTERAAGKGLIFKADTINNNPSFFAASADLRGWICHALAARLPVSAQDWPLTTYDVIYLTAVGGATHTLWSFSRDATTNPILKTHITSATPAVLHQRSDNLAGSTQIVSANSSIAATTMYIITVRYTGLGGTIYINDVASGTINQAADRDVLTLNRAAVGYSLSNSSGTPVENNYFGGHLMRSIGVNKLHGRDESTYWFKKLRDQYGHPV